MGDYIPSYICTENGLTESDIRIYPILENGEWVATLQAYETNGIWNAQLSNIYADKAGLIGENTELSMVFDKDTGYLRKNGSMTEVVSYDTVMGRTEFSAVAVPATRSQEVFQTAKLENRRKIDIDQFKAFESAVLQRSSLPGQVTLDVPLVTKHEVTPPPDEVNGACWAASIKAIGGYYGINFSIDYLYDYAQVSKYEGVDIDKIVSVASSILNKNTVKKYSYNYSFIELQEDLYGGGNGNPIIGRADIPVDDSGATYKHAVAIRSYVRYESSSTYVGTFSYVENEHNPARYVVSSVSQSNNASNTFPYIFDNLQIAAFGAFVEIS